MTGPEQTPQDRGRELTLGLVTGEHGVTGAQARAAALVVLGHATDGDDAIELLAMLGLIHAGHPSATTRVHEYFCSGMETPSHRARRSPSHSPGESC